MEKRVCVWQGSNVSMCTECLPNEFRIMSFTAKLEKVRFVTREREQDTVGVLFSSSLPVFKDEPKWLSPGFGLLRLRPQLLPKLPKGR